MRKLTTSAVLMAASAAVSGCASLGVSGAWGDADGVAWDSVRSTRGAIVRAEQPAPAPAGVAAFCERMEEVCAVRDDTATSDLMQPAAWRTDGVRALPWVAHGEDGAALFAQMLAARAAGVQIDYERREIPLTERLWRELSAVNQAVNRGIASSSDANTYGVDEYWAMPMTEQTGELQGDCEDYALEKRARLIALGWDSSALALAVAHAPGVGMHAVLIAQTDHGDFVLDNLHDAPRSPRSLNYRWVSRQAGRSLTTWASARIDAAPQRERRDEIHFASAAAAAAGRQPIMVLAPLADSAS